MHSFFYDEKFFTTGAHVLWTTTQPTCVMQNCYTYCTDREYVLCIYFNFWWQWQSRWNQGSDGNKILKHVTPFWCTKREITSEIESVINKKYYTNLSKELQMLPNVLVKMNGAFDKNAGSFQKMYTLHWFTKSFVCKRANEQQ